MWGFVVFCFRLQVRKQHLGKSEAMDLWVPPMREIEWAQVTEDERVIKIETERLEAAIPK